MTISISVTGHSAYCADDEDRWRAQEAAENVIRSAGITPAEAYDVYKAQFLALDDEAGMTGDALIWIEARQAADIALTSTWADPAAEVFCEMTA